MLLGFLIQESKPELMTPFSKNHQELRLPWEIALPWGPKRVWLLSVFEAKSGKMCPFTDAMYGAPYVHLAIYQS